MEWNILDLLLALIITLYALALATLSIGLLFYDPVPENRKKYFISVLIAARNEENHIGHCLQYLLMQTYPRDHFEIIVIDDRSTDRTAAIVRSFQKEFEHIRLVSIAEPSPTMAPKKHALNEGIKLAKGEILVCTDADCRPEKNWLGAMTAVFSDNVGMVVGFSPIEPRKKLSLFDNFVALDSLALASVAAAGSAFGMTLTATGRSLAYRKCVFDEVGGFSRIATFISGDDDLLLGLVKKTKWRTAYCMGEQALVYTDPPPTLRSFVYQKIRQASKSPHYSFKMITGLVILYFMNVSLITYVPAKIFFSYTSTSSSFYVILWIIKLSSDFLILCVGASRFKKWPFLLLYPIIALLHPIYIMVFGAWGLIGKFKWKETSSTPSN